MTDKQSFATKSDLKKLENKLGRRIDGNTKAIEELLKKVDDNGKEMLAFKWEIDKKLQDYQERTEGLITKFKDEIIGHIDPVLKELTRMREEQAIIGHQMNEHGEKLEDHEKRISRLETAPL